MSSESISVYTTLILLIFLICTLIILGLWGYNQYLIILNTYYTDAAAVRDDLNQIITLLQGLTPRVQR